MAGVRSRQKGLFDHLSSPWTLLPVTAGLSVGIIGWAVRWQPPWQVTAMFLASLLVGAGLALTQMILNSDNQSGDTSELRKELLVSLDLVGRPDERPQPGESAEQFGAATPAA